MIISLIFGTSTCDSILTVQKQITVMILISRTLSVRTCLNVLYVLVKLSHGCICASYLNNGLIIMTNCEISKMSLASVSCSNSLQ